MKVFKKSFGGPKKRPGSTHGGSPSWNAGFGGKKESFKARCNECGDPCSVPFKPNGRKPVLCSTCFRTNGPSPSKPSFGDRPAFKRSNDRPSFESRPSAPSMKREIDEINTKLDRILAILGKSAPAAPISPSRSTSTPKPRAESYVAPERKFAAAPKPPKDLDDIEWFKD